MVIAGHGFPAARGGPVYYAERAGLAAVIDRIAAFAAAAPAAGWTPAPRLVRTAETGGRFDAPPPTLPEATS